MNTQQALSVRQAGQLLGDRYLRIDMPPAGEVLTTLERMDRADPEATRTLRVLANRSWDERSGDLTLRDFFRP